ncbi:MAG: DUF262 domain-containing protein [Deltaproteobacteria bacterium]|nr:DUF262 domain-containing protein [Deltaproteobacteria bacterium]
MAKSNLLSTSTVNYQALVGNGRKFRVPPHQRDYSWQEEQWEDLWNDVLELRGRPDDRHYMGALVVQAVTDREYRIIDGQQRMATLATLGLAVISRLQELAGQGIDPEANRERAAALRGRFIGEKDPASLIESSRLFLNRTDDPFFQDYLVQLRPPLNPPGLPRSNRLLWECFRYFTDRLRKQAEIASDGEALAGLASEVVAHGLLFIWIVVEDELNAYTVFETLNARGIELTTTDLVKNYLFSRTKVESDIASLERRWRSLLLTVGQERFIELLRYHLLCDVPKIRSVRLFKLIRDRVRTPAEVLELLEALERRAELFCALSDPRHGYWADRGKCRQYVGELCLFRVRQMTPLLFAAWEQLPNDFERVLKLVSVISFRYTVVGSLNPNELEPVYHRAAKAMLDGKARAPADVFDLLRPIYVEDAKFREDFARLAIDTAGQRKRVAKYMLARLESDQSGRLCDADTDPASIEHVLPENPADEWCASFPRERWSACVYRLGNLVLIEPSANRAVGNASYAEKLRAYERSAYATARQIAADAPDEWTPERLEARQQRMAKRAVHLWRADFA